MVGLFICFICLLGLGLVGVAVWVCGFAVFLVVGFGCFIVGLW